MSNRLKWQSITFMGADSFECVKNLQRRLEIYSRGRWSLSNAGHYGKMTAIRPQSLAVTKQSSHALRKTDSALSRTGAAYLGIGCYIFARGCMAQSGFYVIITRDPVPNAMYAHIPVPNAHSLVRT